jgi:phosphate transport system protein
VKRHLERELENLKKKILTLGAMVEGNIEKALLSLTRHKAQWANEVMESDHEIDRAEVEIEEDCLKILALYQPAAIDLRYVVGILKMNTDLERMGDLAVNIAERSAYLADKKGTDLFLDFTTMGEKTIAMVKKALDSLIRMDPSLAREVCVADDEVDIMNREILISIQQHIEKNPKEVKLLVHLLLVSRHLERIADQATNIAEDVIYMTEGTIIRHHAEDYTRHD